MPDETIIGIMNDKDQIKGQLGKRDKNDFVFKKQTENLFPKAGTLIVSKRSIGTAFILGHTVNGLLGATGVGLGAGTFGSLVVNRVVNFNNLWREMIRSTTFKDTGNTTADWNTTTFKWDFDDTEIIQTKSLFLNSETVIAATLNIVAAQITTVGNLIFQISADGGSHWETVSLGVENVFTNTGTDLRLKITASGGTASIDVDDSDGYSFPIRLSYRV